MIACTLGERSVTRRMATATRPPTAPTMNPRVSPIAATRQPKYPRVNPMTPPRRTSPSPNPPRLTAYISSSTATHAAAQTAIHANRVGSWRAANAATASSGATPAAVA